MNVQNEVILLLGKTGAGKSTFGNQLLGSRENKPFKASDDLESQTSKCEVATLTINGKEYDLVDTPGLFDNKGVDPLKEITEFVHKCAGGVRAILLVLEAGRITDEEKNALRTIREFLGKDATDNFIIVFSKASPERVKDKKIAWRKIDVLRDFIEQIENRWRVAPMYVSPMYPQLFELYRETNERRLMEIKECIGHIQVLYTTKQFLENQKRLAEEQRKKKEDDERRKREYEDKIRAEAAEKVRRDMEEKARQERERMRREMEDKQDQLLAKQKQLEDDLEYRNRYQDSYRNRRKGRKVQDSDSDSESTSYSVTKTTCSFPVKYVVPSPNLEVFKNPVVYEDSKKATNEGSREVINTDPIVKKAMLGASIGSVFGPLGAIAGGFFGLMKGIEDEKK